MHTCYIQALEDEVEAFYMYMDLIKIDPSHKEKLHEYAKNELEHFDGLIEIVWHKDATYTDMETAVWESYERKSAKMHHCIEK